MIAADAGLPRLLRLVPLVAAAAVAAFAAVLQAGAAGGALTTAALGFGAGLVAWARSAESADRAIVARVATGAVLAVPGLLIVFLSFSAGGFFADSVAVAALVLAVLFALRCSLAAQPFGALRARALVPVVALALFAGWALLSGRWSHAPGRAIVEFDRALLYLLALVLFASLADGRDRLATAVRVVAAAFVLVAAVALLSRLAPDLYPTDALIEKSRLAYPLGYWNALGLLCGIAAILCLHLSSSTRESRPTRVLAAGALPMLGATLFLTFSRGGAAAAILGLALYAVVGRPRGLVPALLAAAPATALAVHGTFDATLLAGQHPTSPAAVAQGHGLAKTVLMCVAGAMVARAILAALLDERLRRARLSDRTREPITRGAWATAAVVAFAAVLVFNVPATVAERWDQFVQQSSVSGGADNLRGRFSSTSNQGRLEHWRVAMDGYRAHPMAGNGAGTFEELWSRDRHNDAQVTDAHSLYIETLGELGIVGLALLAVAVGGLLVGLAPVRRGRDRSLFAAVFAAAVAWAVHAGLDWDWEMPAVTLWIFVLGGLALGGRRSASSAPRTRRVPHLVPAVLGAAVLLLAGVPALVLASQTRLDRAYDALTANDCPGAVAAARSSTAVLGSRTQPLEITAVCQARAEHYGRSLATLRVALAKDPGDWRLHAWTAAAVAANGGDPWPEIRRAAALNPRDPATTDLRGAFAPTRRHEWVRAGGRYLREKVMPQR